MLAARSSRNSVQLTAVVLAAALVAWIVTIVRMQGMDAGPGTDLGGLGWYLGVWVTMMAAMMLPAAAPMVLVFSRVSRERARRGAAHIPTLVFVTGYLLAWVGFGIAAYAVFRGVIALEPAFLDWDAAGPWIAGGAIVAAGVYQLTPLKQVCLRHCRTPLHFVFHGWREGWLGAVRMGVVHGAYCVGCCWGLMVILFALGVMSVVWMVVLATIVFAEKVTPVGTRLSRVLAVAFVVLGVWVAAAPDSVPGLMEPGGGDAPEMQMAP